MPRKARTLARESDQLTEEVAVAADGELKKPADVADLFVETCQRLRAMGCTRVEAFGLIANFGSPAAPPVAEERRREQKL